MNRFDSLDDLQGRLRDAVIDLLYRLADDDLIIGHRNSEWTGLAPILEEDIAFSSMANQGNYEKILSVSGSVFGENVRHHSSGHDNA